MKTKRNINNAFSDKQNQNERNKTFTLKAMAMVVVFGDDIVGAGETHDGWV